MFSSIFYKVDVLIIFAFFIFPVFNVFALIITLIDIKSFIQFKRRDLKVFSKINSADDVPFFNEYIKERLDSFIMMSYMLGFKVELKFGLKDDSSECFRLYIRNDNSHVELNSYFSNGKNQSSSVYIIERGTSIDVESESLDTCLQIIEQRMR